MSRESPTCGPVVTSMAGCGSAQADRDLGQGAGLSSRARCWLSSKTRRYCRFYFSDVILAPLSDLKPNLTQRNTPLPAMRLVCIAGKRATRGSQVARWWRSFRGQPLRVRDQKQALQQSHDVESTSLSQHLRARRDTELVALQRPQCRQLFPLPALVVRR